MLTQLQTHGPKMSSKSPVYWVVFQISSRFHLILDLNTVDLEEMFDLAYLQVFLT